jgi:hypothetical protein
MLIIHNAPVTRVIQSGLGVPSGDDPNKPTPQTAQFNLPTVNQPDPDVVMFVLAGDFAFGGGVGGAIDAVLINKGEGKGLFFYGAGDANVGFNIGVGVVGGPISFNSGLGVKLDRDAFVGWSNAVSVGLGFVGGSYVFAYTDAQEHFPGMPWNPPILYSGTLVGFARGVPKLDFGAMLTWSKASLFNNLSITW